MKRMIAAGFAAAALLLAPVANATPADDDYIDHLTALGFEVIDRAGVLNNADIICARTDAGDSRYEITRDLDEANTGINYVQAKAAVALTILYYCLTPDA